MKVYNYSGRSATEMQVSYDAIPMADGLTIGASYFEFDKQGDKVKKTKKQKVVHTTLLTQLVTFHLVTQKLTKLLVS